MQNGQNVDIRPKFKVGKAIKLVVVLLQLFQSAPMRNLSKFQNPKMKSSQGIIEGFHIILQEILQNGA